MIKIKNAIVSLSNKEGLTKLVKFFESFKINVFATGGTYEILRDYKNRINIINITDYTNFPEIMDGRVKTLHPSIYGGILARKNSKKHKQELKKYNFQFFDLVVVNLYPFEDSITKGSLNEQIEKIDIGGPSMIRAAAKNFENVIVLSNPEQYDYFIENGLRNNNTYDFEYSRRLAADAFQLISHYDCIIANWMGRGIKLDSLSTIPLKKITNLKYGENPHQRSSLYSSGENPFVKLSGKELSYNNILDLDVARNLVSEFKESSCVIVKHGSPCGVASRKSQVNAFELALGCDKISAFGGIIAFNKKLEEKTAKILSRFFFEAIVAPEYDVGALDFLKKRKKNLIIIRYKSKKPSLDFSIRSTRNFLLVQDFDLVNTKKQKTMCVSKNKPSKRNLEDLQFAFTIAKYVNSNAIVIAKNNVTIGIGVGETSRIESAKQAIKKVTSPYKNCVLASDGFFPFPDIIPLCKRNNIVSIIQPGGSINDQEVISQANKVGISMLFTQLRHFKH